MPKGDELLLTPEGKMRLTEWIFRYLDRSTEAYNKGSLSNQDRAKHIIELVEGELKAILTKARPIIEKQQQAKDTEYYAEMMKIAVDRVRRVAEKQKGEEIHDMATGRETRASDKGSIWVRFPISVWQGLKEEE